MDELFAPAKLTVSLHVMGRRDDGYHLIDAEMVSLDFGDRLEVSDGDGLEIVGPAAEGVPADDTNLIRRALSLVDRAAQVRVQKHIPAGAGLGGGSTDAAAILRWAGVRDRRIAASLGADVAFCLTGGRARVSGIGEVVEPLPFVDRTFTVVTPPLFVSTAAVYRAWDELPAQTADNGNDLERAALAVEPRLAEWRDRVERATGLRPMLAGSGSTWFVEGDHGDVAAALEPALVVVTRTDRP